MSADVATHWEIGEPNNGGNSDCGFIYNKAMQDNPCERKYRFMCQRRLRGRCLVPATQRPYQIVFPPTVPTCDVNLGVESDPNQFSPNFGASNALTDSTGTFLWIILN